MSIREKKISATFYTVKVYFKNEGEIEIFYIDKERESLLLLEFQ